MQHDGLKKWYGRDVASVADNDDTGSAQQVMMSHPVTAIIIEYKHDLHRQIQDFLQN